ncbi:MAG TPA: AraC family transcriptional regulator [Chitinophaga sp.]|uniref:AraC family transcriptional regulator n=1 Tax=Chitinophaga sp. TaxID=1869181 RepID=UPI002DBB033B|nr:AraC family transcriptional regulator [Chitinophaga sp.]HEU4551506.1 AraC family transcriptional regulator [Chitinophaga sp.]
MNNTFFKYLKIGPVEEKWGLYVTSVGYSKVEPNEAYPNQPHPQSNELIWNKGRILNDFYVVFIAKGKGVYDSKAMPASEVEEGTCFFLFPQVWHRYKPDIKLGWEEYWVGFNGYYAQQLMAKGFFNTSTPFINIRLNKDILILFRRLIDTVKESLTGYPQQLAGITLQLLGLIHTVAVHKAFDNDPVGRLISKAQFLLHESLENHVDMEELARQLPMGYSSFRKAFRKITGESPNQYHINIRLNRAKDLLASTALNINEVAEQTGFDSVFYFSKLFKIKNGLSPNAFRKSAYQPGQPD